MAGFLSTAPYIAPRTRPQSGWPVGRSAASLGRAHIPARSPDGRARRAPEPAEAESAPAQDPGDPAGAGPGRGLRRSAGRGGPRGAPLPAEPARRPLPRRPRGGLDPRRRGARQPRGLRRPGAQGPAEPGTWGRPGPDTGGARLRDGRGETALPPGAPLRPAGGANHPGVGDPPRPGLGTVGVAEG